MNTRNKRIIISVIIAIIALSVGIGASQAYNAHNDKKEELQEQKKKYIVVATDYSSDMSILLADFSLLNSEWISGNMNNVRSGWVDEMGEVLFDMGNVMDTYEDEANPTEDVEKVHKYYMKAIDEHRFLVDNYADAFDNVDTDLLEEISKHTTKATDYITKAGDELDKVDD